MKRSVRCAELPNHVLNIVTLYGDEKRIEQLRNEQLQEGGGPGSLDFQKIIPMPESLNIESGSRTSDAIKLYQAAVSCGIREASYAGCGERLKEVLQNSDRNLAERMGNFDLEERFKLGKTAMDNLMRYHAATWYEWCTEHWGTKWNGYDLGEGYPCEKNQLRFYTAWAAPHPVLQQLSVLYPDVVLDHRWADEDLGYNLGERTYQAGKVTSEKFLMEGTPEALMFACELLGYDTGEILFEQNMEAEIKLQ